MSKGKGPGGWPSTTGNPSGKGRDNNPPHKKGSGDNPSGGGRDISSVADKINAVADILIAVAKIGELATSAFKKLQKWRLSRKKVVHLPNSDEDSQE